MIEIKPYQEKWPLEFQQIATRLKEALGDVALRIDHIGSTSVPGLAAKDIIDSNATPSPSVTICGPIPKRLLPTPNSNAASPPTWPTN
jgi:GrpB-like predicted nucleotidyltransferase (UPF0157 family)